MKFANDGLGPPRQRGHCDQCGEDTIVVYCIVLDTYFCSPECAVERYRELQMAEQQPQEPMNG